MCITSLFLQALRDSFDAFVESPSKRRRLSYDQLSIQFSHSRSVPESSGYTEHNYSNAGNPTVTVLSSCYDRSRCIDLERSSNSKRDLCEHRQEPSNQNASRKPFSMRINATTNTAPKTRIKLTALTAERFYKHDDVQFGSSPFHFHSFFGSFHDPALSVMFRRTLQGRSWSHERSPTSDIDDEDDDLCAVDRGERASSISRSIQTAPSCLSSSVRLETSRSLRLLLEG